MTRTPFITTTKGLTEPLFVVNYSHNMKIILTDYEDYSEVIVRGASGTNEHVYTFDDHKQARAFCNGFACARKCAINAVYSSLPMDYEARKA